jgi:hypothetical protein
LIIGDAHQRHCFEGCPFARCDDGQNRLALVAHDVGCERRLVVLAELDEAQERIEIDRHVGATNDAFDARRARCRRIVDRADARMRVRAAKNL